MASSNWIPVAEPTLSEFELSYASEAIASGWISANGASSIEMERNLAEYHSVSSALLVSNGTVALHLALVSLGIGPGDEVILPSLAYIAPANAVRYVGATPVFADVDPVTWNVDAGSVRRLIGPRTRAIVAVHNYGVPADTPTLRSLADEHGLWLVEDAAEAIFARCHGKLVGSEGHVATFSFFGNKVITCGEGGAVITNDQQLAQRMQLLRNQGMDPERRYHFPVVGFNYRLSNVSAAILRGQWDTRDRLLSRREEIFARYEEAFSAMEGVSIQTVPHWASRSPWLYCLVVEDHAKVSRDEVIDLLASREIDSRPFFEPIHRQEPYLGSKTDQECPNSVALSHAGFNLPTFAHMTGQQVTRVIEAVADAIGG